MPGKPEKRCPGHMRHWYGVHGYVGFRTPVCARCGALNPRKLTKDEFHEIRAYRRSYPVGKHVEAFFNDRYGADEEGDNDGER